MSNIFIIILLIVKNVLSLPLEECSELIDCFNCTLNRGCIWENKKCLNSTDNIYNDTLLNTDNSTILYQDLKYIRNICFDTKAPHIPEENYIYNEISTQYCGSNLFFLRDGNLLNGIRIELKNNSGLYGTPNLICEYIITHGRKRIDADIYINRSLSQDFLLFYSDDFDESIQINYSSTLSVYYTSINSASFLFYSNKTFETSPFLIYFKIEPLPEDSEVLTYLFLAAIIGFIALAVAGIIFVRKCSLFFKLNKKNKNEKEINEENEGNLSVISEKNVEENSKNDIDFDSQEIKAIKKNIGEDVNKKDTIDKDKNIT